MILAQFRWSIFKQELLLRVKQRLIIKHLYIYILRLHPHVIILALSILFVHNIILIEL